MHLYAETSRILKTVKEKRGAVKTLVYSSRFHNKRKLYALVCETLKFSQILSLLLKRAKLPQKITAYDDKKCLFIVLAYEFFVGQGLDKSKGVAKLFFKHSHIIQREHDKLLAERNVGSLSDLIPKQENASLPRYVRVNMLKTTVEKTVHQFKKEGWKLKKLTTRRSLVEDMESLGTQEFLQDPHLSDVLVFPPGTDLHKHKMCASGEIILQDKASCFPAHVLNPPEGSVVIDCCAAPGNKTSHVASLLHNTGKIFAFDKDGSRLKTMQKMLEIAGVTNTETACQDFLSVDPMDETYDAVEYIVVDPSCSGSGIVGRLNHLVDKEEMSESRLKSLSNFQVTVLKHALSFPNVKRVVYSTCSIHAQENENVVGEVIQQVGQDFKLQKAFPNWPNRGVEGYEHAQKCLRMSPDHDLTNGFFVACFERKDKGFEIVFPESGMSKNETGLTRKEKRKLKKRAKKRKLRDEKISCFENENCNTQKEKKKGTQVLDSSYRMTVMSHVIRVDNSLHGCLDRPAWFKKSRIDRDRLCSVGNGLVRMFRKWKIDFTVKGNKTCCIVECNPINRKKIAKDKMMFVSGKTYAARADCAKTVKERTLTTAEKRKLKKKKRKLMKNRSLKT